MIGCGVFEAVQVESVNRERTAYLQFISTPSPTDWTRAPIALKYVEIVRMGRETIFRWFKSLRSASSYPPLAVLSPPLSSCKEDEQGDDNGETRVGIRGGRRERTA